MKKCFFMLMVLMVCYSSQAQNKLTIDKVYKVSLRSSGTIMEKELIKGYYFLYVSDKIDKKTNEYTLQILDENLNKVKDIKFSDSKDIGLIESSYNGNSLSFLFYNDKDNVLEYRIFGMDGKQRFIYSKDLDKKSEAYFKQQRAMMSSDEGTNQNVFDVKDKGYLSLTPIRENKKYTYEINFYNSEKRRSWSYNPVDTDKFTTAQFLGANDSVALFEILSKEKLMSKDMESTILGVNLENGKKAFEIRTVDKSNQLYPMNISIIDGRNEFMVIGLYYEGGDRVIQDKSQGLGIWLMNNQGKIIRSKYVSWASDMNKYVSVDHKGRLGDMGYVYIHKIMQTEDGKIFAIGEGYKKVADGVGIAMNVLSGSYSAGMTKLKITDMLFMELNSNFELVNAKIYEKNNNNFSLSTGSDFVTPHTMAFYAKNFGYFDYTFTQMGKNNTSFNAAYTDYEKSKGYKGLTFNTISYFEGKISTDKINLKSDASNMVILPARQGSVMIVEYFKKEKKLEMRLEKLN